MKLRWGICCLAVFCILAATAFHAAATTTVIKRGGEEVGRYEVNDGIDRVVEVQEPERAAATGVEENIVSDPQPAAEPASKKNQWMQQGMIVFVGVLGFIWLRQRFQP